MSNSLFRSIAVIGFLAASLACAQEPVQNIDRERHGNLATAQKLVREAFDRLTEAQAANNYDLGAMPIRLRSCFDRRTRRSNSPQSRRTGSEDPIVPGRLP
jgi:hypothetical protein